MTTSTTRTTGTGRRRRAVLALAVAAAVVGTTVPASAAAPAAVPGTDATRADRLAGDVRENGFDASARPEVSAAAAVDPAPCPTANLRTRTVLYEGFEDGLPDFGEYTYGFGIDTVNAPVGTAMASSIQDPSVNDDDHVMFMEDSYATPGARTFLSFLGRGHTVDVNTGVVVNGYGWGLDDAPEQFVRYVIEISPLVSADDRGYLEIGFVHLFDAPEQTSMEIDDVQVYSCAPPPASGVRGDWTGEGLTDLLAVDAAGDLRLYRGRGDATITSGIKVGNGWGAFTWIGSPGDITGDRRSDLLARRADGTMVRYDGRGAGGFGSAVVIGNGWNAMTALTSAGDLDGDGGKDLLARSADGKLYRYPITAAGRIGAGVQLATGWGALTTLVAMGDLNGDKVTDVVGTLANGEMYLYTGSKAGLRGQGRIGTGWQDFDLLTSPGDLNRDGRGDLVARKADGDLYVWTSTATGLRKAVKVGNGWGGTTTLL